MTRLAVDPTHATTVYVTLSGYRAGSFQPHILVSHNAGASWTDLSGNLPQAPVNDIEYDTSHHRLVAATFGRGIYQIHTP